MRLVIAVVLATSFSGLWTARRDFGPAVAGELWIVREGSAWHASIAGREAEVSVDGTSLSFALPNDEGRFRGAIRGKRIIGHWIQPNGTSMGVMATPVTLWSAAAEPLLSKAAALPPHSISRWHGMVAPAADHMTFFLPVADDFKTYLRNPERNVGIFWKNLELAADGDRVELKGRSTFSGRYDAENETLSIALPRGGTYDFHRATPAEQAAFAPRAKVAYAYRKPLARDDGWATASAEEVNVDREAITQLVNFLTDMPMDSLGAPQIHAFLLARHGKLVVEEYFHGTNPDEAHDTRSAAKSLTALLAGTGHVSEKTPVYATLGRGVTGDARKDSLTLEHLLTQTSGLDCDDGDENSPGAEDRIQDDAEHPDWYRVTLDLKSIRDPGQKVVYCSIQPNLAGAVIARKTGQWLPDLFRETIADPMQMHGYAMWLQPDGEAYMGGSVRLRPRDFLKLAQLVVGEGKWNGRQIVPAAWIAKMITPRYPFPDRNHFRDYGYLWYVQDFPYRGRTVRAFYGGGNGGQVMIAIPELDLAVAFMGGSYGDTPATYFSQTELVPKYVLPATR